MRLVLFAASLLAATGGLIQPASGQDQLPSALTSATSLSGSQTATIDDFVQQWSTALLEGNDAAVTDARERLIQPIRASTSDVFLDRYAAAVRNELPAALDARRLITRLNAMIVAAQLGGRDVYPVVIKGLGDPSPAVRYWAARAVVEVAEAKARGARVSGGVMNDLLEALTTLIAEETNPLVLEPALLAAVRLDVPRGEQLFLNTLERVLADHADQPRRSYRTLDQPWRDLIRRSITENNTQNLRQSARQAARIMGLIARQLEAGVFPEGLPPSHAEMIQLAQQILSGAHQQLEATGSPPTTRQVQNALQQRDWASLAVAADAWLAMLQREPYNFSRDELRLPS